MKKLKKAFFKMTIPALAFSSLFWTACNNKSNEPAIPINAEQFEKLRENKDNNDKRFSITGYPYLNRDVTITSDMKVSVGFYTAPNGTGEYIGSINLGYKDSTNGVYIPQKFTNDDLQIFDNEGNKLGPNDKITASFTMELDTNRPPSAASTVPKFKDGKMTTVTTGPQYFGTGPIDLKIEQAK